MEVAAIASGSHVFASSEWRYDHSVKSIMLNSRSMGEGSFSWCSKVADNNQWVAVGLDTPKQVIAVATQGRGDEDQWIEEYTVKYSMNGQDWLYVDNGRIFSGNQDQHTIVKQMFNQPILARTIRVCPTKWNKHVSMRMEVYYMPVSNTEVAAIACGARTYASSEFQWDYGINAFRLQHAHSWCAKDLDLNQWGGVGFETPKQIIAVATQGRSDYEQWVEEYLVKYSLNGTDWFAVDNGAIFEANTDQNSVVKHVFAKPVMARAIRVCPVKWHKYISMRMEVYYLV